MQVLAALLASWALISGPFLFVSVSASMWCGPYLCSTETLPSAFPPRKHFCLHPHCKVHTESASPVYVVCLSHKPSPVHPLLCTSVHLLHQLILGWPVGQPQS